MVVATRARSRVDDRPGAVLGRYVMAAVLVRLADEGARVALVLLAIERTGSAAYGGLLVAALMVPHVVAGPVVGAVADAVRRRRLFYTLALLGYGGALVAAVTSAAASRPLSIALVVLAGCLAPVMLGGLTSLLRDLVPDRLDSAFGVDATSYNLAGIAGPAIAAVTAGAAGAGAATVVLAALVALGGVVLWTLPIPDRPARADRDAAPGRLNPLGGIPLLWRRPRLGAVTLASSFGQLGVGALPVVAALLAGRFQHTTYTGLFLAAASVGGLVGSLWCARHPIRSHPPERVVVASLLAMAVPFALVPLVPAVWATLPLFALVGLLNGPLFCAVLAVREREAPPAAHTQVFTVGAGLKSTAAAAGAALAGACTGSGVGLLLLGVAACQAFGAVAGAAVLRLSARPAGSAGQPGGGW
ncbi:MFS transporter [Micromonospora sp. NPDC023966]|uniref:MFS transporter n=1 Tax=Micromonospora sp. NPDC023966 TaxID=3154699 RepID=UPI0033F6800C